MTGIFNRVENDERIFNNSDCIWNMESWQKHRSYAFVIYNNKGEYVDSLDPIEEIYRDDDNIYIRHYNSFSVGLQQINIKELMDKEYRCEVEQMHYLYQCNDVCKIYLEIPELRGEDY